MCALQARLKHRPRCKRGRVGNSAVLRTLAAISPAFATRAYERVVCDDHASLVRSNLRATSTPQASPALQTRASGNADVNAASLLD